MKATQIAQAMELAKQDAADMSKTTREVTETVDATASNSVNKLTGKNVIDAS